MTDSTRTARETIFDMENPLGRLANLEALMRSLVDANASVSAGEMYLMADVLGDSRKRLHGQWQSLFGNVVSDGS